MLSPLPFIPTTSLTRLVRLDFSPTKHITTSNTKIQTPHTDNASLLLCNQPVQRLGNFRCAAHPITEHCRIGDPGQLTINSRGGDFSTPPSSWSLLQSSPPPCWELFTTLLTPVLSHHFIRPIRTSRRLTSIFSSFSSHSLHVCVQAFFEPSFVSLIWIFGSVLFFLFEHFVNYSCYFNTPPASSDFTLREQSPRIPTCIVS